VIGWGFGRVILGVVCGGAVARMCEGVKSLEKLFGKGWCFQIVLVHNTHF
jgi:hypothetical protein